MKNVIIPVLIAIAITTTAFASGNSINRNANKEFTKALANAKKVSYKTFDGFQKASYLTGNEKVDVFYDQYGEFVGTSKTMAFDKLPKRALETITSKYTFPEYQLKECISFSNADNEINYYISMEKNNQILILEISKYGLVSLFTPVKK